MKNLFVILAVITLSACAPTTTTMYYKQGAQLPVTQQHYDSCKIRSFKEIPQNIITDYYPGSHDPGRLRCRNTIPGYADCERIGGHSIPPSVTHRDANAGLRDRFMQNCMAEKGYTLMTFRYCEDGQLGYHPLNSAPPLNQIYCVQRNTPQLQD